VLIVQVADGLFEPRDVEVGERSSDWVEVKFGAKEGEKIVVAANFLIDAESNLRAALGGMGAGKGVAHAARGTLDGIGGGGQVTISHEPVPDLKWPAMTMDFILANPAVASGVKAGAAIDFEFVERKPGEWVITAMRPAGPARPTNAPSPAQHKGH
jgi:Cu/Ag efflux protein CusF